MLPEFVQALAVLGEEGVVQDGARVAGLGVEHAFGDGLQQCHVAADADVQELVRDLGAVADDALDLLRVLVPAQAGLRQGIDGDDLAAVFLARLQLGQHALSDKACPEASIGPHCLAPYECLLRAECWGFYREQHIRFTGGKAAQFSLYDQGIMSIGDIPDNIVLSRQQQIQKECVMTGKVHVEKEEIRRFLDKLEYPLYYLDFETFGPAIPIYDGTRPYQDIPFQFSLHVVEDHASEPVHHSFLADGTEDPRPHILRELRRLLGSDGSIIAYNAGFEEGVLRELVDAYPEYTLWLEGILTRMVDLLHPFTNFHYYHASQKDTASLKKVLPAVTGKSYRRIGYRCQDGRKRRLREDIVWQSNTRGNCQGAG